MKDGPKRKHRLGTYPEVSLRQARASALELHVEAEQGVDRVASARVAREAEAERAARQLSVREALQLYDELHCQRLRSGKDNMRSLNAALAPYMDAPVASLTRAHLHDAIDQKFATGAEVQANRLAAYLSGFSKFAWQREIIPEHIGGRIKKPRKEVPRSRVLSLPEIKEIWWASYKCGPLWGPRLRLIIATAQRSGQIGRLQWHEVDFENKQLVFGSRRTKNSDWNHFVDLDDSLVYELQLLKRRSEEKWGEEGIEQRFVFTTTGTTPASGISKHKTKLDEILGPNFQSWIVHDIRTGFATHMCEEGYDEAVIDRILNHGAVSSAPSNVARVYNRAKAKSKRRKAILDWLEALIDVTPDRATNPSTGGGLSLQKPISLKKVNSGKETDPNEIVPDTSGPMQGSV